VTVSGTGAPGPEEPSGPERFAALPEETQAVLLRVAEVLGTISFGTVLLVVQDAKVVQIETAEKFRLR
jgi:hypothetical protein